MLGLVFRSVIALISNIQEFFKPITFFFFCIFLIITFTAIFHCFVYFIHVFTFCISTLSRNTIQYLKAFTFLSLFHNFKWINLFDSFKKIKILKKYYYLLQDNRERETNIHQRIEKKWLGSIKIPFSTVYFNNKVWQSPFQF